MCALNHIYWISLSGTWFCWYSVFECRIPISVTLQDTFQIFWYQLRGIKDTNLRALKKIIILLIDLNWVSWTTNGYLRLKQSSNFDKIERVPYTYIQFARAICTLKFYIVLLLKFEMFSTLLSDGRYVWRLCYPLICRFETTGPSHRF